MLIELRRAAHAAAAGARPGPTRPLTPSCAGGTLIPIAMAPASKEMMDLRMRIGATALTAVAMVAALSVPPAFGASYSGDRACPGTFTPQLRIDAGAPGNGSWTSNTTGEVRSFTFPGGASYRYAPFQNVHWVTVASWFYYKPVSTCWQ